MAEVLEMRKTERRRRITKVSSENSEIISRALTLLTGKPYTNAAQTDISETFQKMGWIPPSERGKK